jgi:prepilin-type N-terminal cleavage/methylation domain-containing protein
MFIKPLQRRHGRGAGFTLLETMVASAIGGIVMTALMAVTFYTGRSVASLADSVALNNDSRSVIDRISQKIRQAEEVTAYSTNSITVNISSNALTYAYVPADAKLYEIENSVTNVLLENCTSLVFDLYRRNPITNSFDQFPATDNIAEAKLVRIKWTCRSKGQDTATGSSELISSKIVLRSK